MASGGSSRALPIAGAALCAYLAAVGCAPRSDAPATAPAADPAPATRSPTPELDVPIERARSGHVLVRARLGEGPPLSFVLDSGASVSVITPQTRDAAGLAADAGQPVVAHGAGGAVSDVRLVTLPDLVVGDRTVRGHQAAVMPLAHLESKLGAPIAGILGRNFLDGHVVELDLARGRLRLFLPASAPELPDDAFPFERFEPVGLIRLTARLSPGDAPVTAVFDLGAGRSVMSWSAARAAGFRPDDPRVRPVREGLLGADATALDAVEVSLEAVEIGPVRFDRPGVLVADLPVFGALGLSDAPAMVLGLDLLAGRVITLDFVAGKMAIARPVSSGAEGADPHSTKGTTARRAGG